VVFAALGLAAYNQARFGSWTDFGAEHQLGYLPYSFSIARFPSTLHAYLLREVLVTCRFPYIFAPAGAGAMPPDWMFAKQTGYLSLEPTVGMLIAAPWVLFGLVALGSARRIYRQASRAAPGAAIDARDRLYLWLVTACFASALLAGVPALGMQFSTMRFLADFTSAALLMAAVGFWTLLSRAGSAGRRRAAHAAGALLGLYTVVFSILIGFQGGYYDSFHRWNPALRDRLLAGLSLCDAREDRRSGRRDPAVAPGERPVQRSARRGADRFGGPAMGLGEASSRQRGEPGVPMHARVAGVGFRRADGLGRGGDHLRRPVRLLPRAAQIARRHLPQAFPTQGELRLAGYFPNTCFSRSVARAAGLVRICFSCSPTTVKRPERVFSVT
jgi:hypothetical protein